jgi:ATP-dependent Lon protease
VRGGGLASLVAGRSRSWDAANSMTTTNESRTGGADASSGAEGSTGRSRPIPDDALIVVPVRNVVLFPGVIIPLAVGRARSVSAAQAAIDAGAPVGLLMQRAESAETPGPDDLHWVGTVGSVLRHAKASDGSYHLVCQGTQRFRVLQFLDGYPFLVARVTRIEERYVPGPDVEARAVALRQLASEAIRLLPSLPAELAQALNAVEAPSALADLVGGFLELKPAEQQELLETFDVATRLDKVGAILGRRLEVLKLSKEINDKTRQTIEGQQREHLLREQMKTIRQELGDEDRGAEVDELTAAVGRAGLPEEAAKHARRELKKLERMPEGAVEHGMTRTYLEWLAELPWNAESAREVEISEARAVLDEDHYGLERVKRRVLEFLAMRKLNPTGKSPILCLAGPPGVGKTSLGQSIARATGRKFVRVSLGGVHDEAEMRGHRRTYVGSMPGNVIQALRRAGTPDCVMLLDEIDKLGAGGFHGDPAAALLEILDPEQNATFRDNYLGVPFDLSRVLFVATANVLETIPAPLRDRLEIIQLPGYTEREKIEIARRYLVPRQYQATGLDPVRYPLADGVVETVIRDYTREAGVRSLERELGAVLRHAALKAAEGHLEGFSIEAGDIAGILGAARFERDMAARAAAPGVVTGLAWTPVGGDILFVEATRMRGGGKLLLTGQLGDVMKESAQAAWSSIRAHADELGIDPVALETWDVHVHVPAGATPKDGPSAGVAMYVALCSMAYGTPVRADLAMTGEISLRGDVLPVGGIKEKVLAADRAGIRTVMLPARNRRDWEEIPADVRESLRFVWLDRVEDAVAEAFGVREAAV